MKLTPTQKIMIHFKYIYDGALVTMKKSLQEKDSAGHEKPPGAVGC